jgi:hypothetical protein
MFKSMNLLFRPRNLKPRIRRHRFCSYRAFHNRLRFNLPPWKIRQR